MMALSYPSQRLLILPCRVSSCCSSHSIQVSIVLLCLNLFFISRVSSLNCVQCVSAETPNCLHGHVAPTHCVGSDTGSTYCLKSVGKRVSGHDHIVFRTCSKTLQTNCSMIRLDGDTYSICHDSCNYDGCNRADSTACTSSLVFVIICALFGL